MPSQIAIELQCTVPSCNFDGFGTKYKTPALEPHQALQLLNRHRADAHDVGEALVDKVEVEITPETVCRPVLPRGCSVVGFKSFNMAWALYAEKYRSQYLDQHPWEVDELRLNYLLNYELLSSIPPLMEGAIYRARNYLVDTVPTADLLIEIKKIVVEEVVRSAQQAVVLSTAKVTGMGVEIDIAEVAQDTTGGQEGGATKEILKSESHCG